MKEVENSYLTPNFYKLNYKAKSAVKKNLPQRNDGNLVRTPIRVPNNMAVVVESYFQYIVREDGCPWPTPLFMARVIEKQRGKEPERQRMKKSDKEPLNWLPK